ncbi:MAG: AsmA-like C-terminal region-containing protein [Flammeovirgaceae bacterium]
MKKIFFGIVGFILLFGVALAVLPMFFKKDIQAFIDKKIEESVNAKVFYDSEQFSLSLFKNFPSMSVMMGNVGIVGKAPFENDTLFYANNFRLDLNLKSVFSDKIEVEGIWVKDLKVYAKVLPDGKANWDIAVSDSTASETPTEESSQMKFRINDWDIENATIVYEDQSMPLMMKMSGTNHSGNGDFTLDNFDMKTQTEVKEFFFTFDSTEFISGKKLTADATINMDMPTMKFTFKENKVALNDFAISFDGFFQMLEEGFDMDIKFAVKETSFKNLISLMPGIYKKDFAGITANGTLAFDGFVKGLMSDVKQSMPAYSVNLKVNEGSFQYPALPSRVEKVFMDMSVKSEDGKTESMVVNVPRFDLEIAQNPIKAKGSLLGLDKFDVEMKAKLDFGVIQQVYPIEDTQLAGLLNVDFVSRGTMKAVTAQDYQSIYTKGEAQLQNFLFSSKDVPQGVKITNAQMTLNPSEIALSQFDGFFGKSDVKMKGILSDYMMYAFKDGVLKGKLSFSSENFDVNEWMSDEATPTTSADTASLEPIIVPKNIDFVFDASLNKVKYTNMELTNLLGTITVKEGIVKMTNLQFNTLGGTVKTTGSYNTQNPKNPLFDFAMDVSSVSFQESYKIFNTVQKLAPIAQNITGTFNTKFNMNGLLGKGMMPVLTSMNGMGDISTQTAALVGVSALNQISSLTGLSQLKDPSLKDFAAKFEINNGKMTLKPTDFEMGGVKSSIMGTTSLDGSIDYVMKVNVKSLGITSGALANVENVSFRIGGTYTSPQVKMEMGDLIKQKKEELLNEGKETVKETAKEVISNVISGNKSDSTQTSTQEQLKEKGKELLDGLFKKKKKGN